LAVVAFAVTTMLLAPYALLTSGAATTAATGTGNGPAASAAGSGTPSTQLGATQLVAESDPATPATPAELARHAAAVRHNEALVRAQRALHARMMHHAWAVQHNEQFVADLHSLQARLSHHAWAVAHNQALWRAAQDRHAAAVARAQAAKNAQHRVTAPRPAAGGSTATGIATWYAWHPGQCASPWLPHGTLVTVTDLATHRTIQCLVTDTEAHNPGRVVDLSQYCFEQLAPLSQGVIEVRISW